MLLLMNVYCVLQRIALSSDCCCCCCCCLHDLNQQLGYVHHHHHIFKCYSVKFSANDNMYMANSSITKNKPGMCVYCVYVFQRKRQDFDSHFYSNSHIYKSIFLLIKNAITVLLSTKFTNNNNNNNNNNTLLLLSYVMCPTNFYSVVRSS